MNVLKKKIFYIPAIIVILLLVWYFSKSGKTSNSAITAKVKRANLSQEVAVSGTVKAIEAVELAFEKSGRVKQVNVSIGEKISQGDLLLVLENGVETSSVEDASAKLESKQAHYDDLKAGGRPEEISVKETELAKAKSDLATYYAGVQNIIFDAFNKSDNAVHRQADILFSNAFSANPQISFTSSDQQAILEAQNARSNMEGILNNFKKIAQNGFTTDTDNENALTQAKNYLVTINDFLIKTNRALNSSINLSDSTLATDKDALNTARNNVNTALGNITNQIQTITTQKITVQTASDQLTLTKAPATTEVLNGAEADIKSADALVKNAKAVLAKTYIISPINGLVTKQDAKVGQIAPANTALVSVASDNFKVEAFVPEVDVAKIAVGNSATITLDAYGSGVSFSAHVVKIDPAETVIDGVSTYKTALEFDTRDERVRSGMTANTTIATATRENCLTIPQRAVYEKNGKKFVRVRVGGIASEEREVTVGIRGTNGDIEILSGLKEGDTVLATGISGK